MKTIKMTPKAGGTPLTATGTQSRIAMSQVPYGQYDLLITQDGYETYADTVTVDSPTELFTILMKILVQKGAVVFDSKNNTIDFTANVSNFYLESMETKLTPNKQYYLETDFPGDLWVTDTLYTPLKSKVVNGKSPTITTGVSGAFGIVGRPATDSDGAKYDKNVTQLENKTYSFVIREAD